MKKYIIFSLALMISSHCNAQNSSRNLSMITVAPCTEGCTINKNYWIVNDSTPVTNNRQYYLDKSKKRRNTGWGLLGAGCGLITIGALVGANANASFDEAGIGIIMAGSGVLMSLGSIPFFISGSVNKHKAMLAISVQPRSSLTYSGKNKNITGISLNIPLNKK